MLLSPKSRAARISCSTTFSRVALGNSMPITVRPGTVETRADSADIDARDIIGQTDHAAGLQARCRFQFIHGDDRAGADATISPLTP